MAIDHGSNGKVDFAENEFASEYNFKTSYIIFEKYTPRPFRRYDVDKRNIQTALIGFTNLHNENHNDPVGVAYL